MGPCTLLLVDEDERRRGVTARLLAGDDLAVVERSAIHEVFADVLTIAPDLVLLSCGEENAEALAACRELRLLDAFYTTPIIFLGEASDDDAIVAALDAGADDYLTGMTSERELLARIGAQLRRRRAREALKWARAQRASFRALALTDALTGVGNRRHCTHAIEDAIARGLPMAVIMIDLDHFKRVNDTCGHEAGDLVLEEVARAIERTVDGGGVVTRWGGEEFAVILSGQAAHRAVEIAELCRCAVADLRFTGMQGVTASIGVAQRAGAHAAMSGSDIVKMADAALYASKANGRDRVSLAPSRVAAVESPWQDERPSEVRVVLRCVLPKPDDLAGARDESPFVDAG
jgi:two-component system cell cycle response regulator